MTIEVQKFKKIKLGVEGAFTKAHLEIYDIDHFRPTYDVLVFFNDSRVGPKNASETRKGYAGRFSVFGHAVCYGDPGHCSIGKEGRRFDLRRSHILTRAFKRIDITDALRKAVKKGGKLSITMIAGTGDEDGMKEVDGKLLSFSGMQIVTFL